MAFPFLRWFWWNKNILRQEKRLCILGGPAGAESAMVWGGERASTKDGRRGEALARGCGGERAFPRSGREGRARHPPRLAGNRDCCGHRVSPRSAVVRYWRRRVPRAAPYRP